MRKGISIWLDVPLEALARRITAVGTDSRPLLHNESGDAYTKVYTLLMILVTPIQLFQFSCLTWI